MIDKNKLKLGLDISRIHHIISRKVDAAVISSIDNNLTVILLVTQQTILKSLSYYLSAYQ